jgi:hypothetical protein
MHNHCAAWSYASRSVNAARTYDRIRVSRKHSHRQANQESRENIFHVANPSNCQSLFDLYERSYVPEMNASRLEARAPRREWAIYLPISYGRLSNTVGTAA